MPDEAWTHVRVRRAVYDALAAEIDAMETGIENCSYVPPNPEGRYTFSDFIALMIEQRRDHRLRRKRSHKTVKTRKRQPQPQTQKEVESE